MKKTDLNTERSRNTKVTVHINSKMQEIKNQIKNKRKLKIKCGVANVKYKT